ncbi:YCG1 (YDR325W) [Zygosaccharomyces parabailii]|nr:YCG1 (YDR325W) [Zygosaccharomyces parabailii]
MDTSVDSVDDVNTRIFHSIADVFQQAQSTYAGHRKHVAVLKKIHAKAVNQGFESAFNYWFSTLVTKILPLKKNEVIGDRVVKLVATFVASLDRELELAKNNSEEFDAEHCEVFSRFVDHFIRHILRGTESRDKNVRYRVVQLLAVIMDNIGELDESLYNLLTWSLNKRIYDKEPNVRIQAVFCLTKFQDDDEAEAMQEEGPENAMQKLMSLIQNDPSAEVRRAAMLNLVDLKLTRPYIFERARDVNLVNRRLIYSRILKQMGRQCFDKIDFKIMDQLIRWGLEDRERSVRQACNRLLSHDWLNIFGGDLIEFLENLNVMESTVADRVMESLFNAREDIIPKLKFPKQIWVEFTVETAFLLRCFYIHCADHDLHGIIEENFPEASELANSLHVYLQKILPSEGLSKLERAHFDCIIEQLLIIANRYDYSDEIGRRSMLTVVRNMLSVFSLPESLIKIGLKVLKSLSINERDFVTMVIEIINDIRDDDIERQEEEQKGGDESESDAEEAAIESFQQSVENLVSKGVSSREALMTNLKPQREARPETIVVCLTRSSHMLELINMPLEQNILITSLIDSLITPAVRNIEPRIRELGVRNLGLCCLLDVRLATDNIYILGMCVSKGNASLKKIALQVIVDIFSVHGLNVVDGEGKVDSISLHKIFYKVLKNDDLPECQVVAAEGLCKLFLADIFTDDDLFETLILSYFSPANSRNEALIQAFAFCIPVYCFSHHQHLQRMARIAADVLLRLCMLWEDLQEDEDEEVDREAMLKPNIIFQQLLNWTDPRKLINQIEAAAKKDNVQLSFLLDFCRVFPKLERRDIRKMLLTNINAAFVTPEQDYDLLKNLEEHLDDMAENENLDTVSLNALQKFRNTVKYAVEEAKNVSMQISRDSLNTSDEQYSQILESSIRQVNVSDKEDDDDISSLNADEEPNSKTSAISVRKRTISEREKQSLSAIVNTDSIDTGSAISATASAMSIESKDKKSAPESEDGNDSMFSKASVSDDEDLINE